MITRTKVDLSEERRILSYMITSTPFLVEVAQVAESRLFESSYSRSVSGWVLEFYQLTKEAPGRAIEDIYRKRSKEMQDDETREMAGEFLSRLSKDWEASVPNNKKYSAEEAICWFKLRSLTQLKDQLEASLQQADPKVGERLVAEYKRIERINGQGIDMFRDFERISSAFNEQEDELFTLPGDLGTAIGPICRGDFISFMGPPKRGKTWWLLYLAQRAALTGVKALHINLEMTENQVTRRIWQSIMGMPRKGEVSFDVGKFLPDGDKWALEYRPMHRTFQVPTKERLASEVRKIQMNARGGGFKVLTFPTQTLTLSALKRELNNLEVYENFVPDFITVDYADIMADDQGMKEERHRLNAIWGGLRGLAQDRQIAIATASQSGRKTMSGKKDVEAEDASEDMRKIAHLTKLITLNQSEAEQSMGIMRLGCKVQREGEAFLDQVVVTQALQIGRPFIDAKIRGRILAHTLPQNRDDSQGDR